MQPSLKWWAVQGWLNLGFCPDRDLCTFLCLAHPFLISVLPVHWYDAVYLGIEEDNFPPF
ncbi:hypothetical protein [Okeania sp. SIO1I7]|uniref:hypothetical protein n=1 Tax=Okeania sp. SIO1I7 TaxID=2607772 RepID=UPI0013F768C8|nr:hypothetical protein [Okeania sp. SIO1I7]NET30005.1 hypothetical protein [Okeania sp. SIO1I7]